MKNLIAMLCLMASSTAFAQRPLEASLSENCSRSIRVARTAEAWLNDKRQGNDPRVIAANVENAGLELDSLEECRSELAGIYNRTPSRVTKKQLAQLSRKVLVLMGIIDGNIFKGL